MIIKFENQMCEIIDFQMVRMQQRQAIFRTKLKNIRTGSVNEHPFRSGERFEEVYIEDRPIQYLYNEGDKFHFMDNETYHEVIVSRSTLGEQVNYLSDNMEVTGRYNEETLLGILLPPSVVLEVTETEPGVRGDTAKSGNKPAKVQTGATIKVPLFVGTGDKIRVDTRTGDYLERA